MKINLSELFSLYSGSVLGNLPLQYGRFVTDSRTVEKGDIFVTIRGNHVDAHDYVDSAIDRGAIGVIVDHFIELPSGFQYVVGSTTDFLVFLGAFARKRASGQFVGITGSAGKTTAKEMLAEILSVKYRVTKTVGNMNTDVSLPIFMANSVNGDEDFVVVEMGVQRPNDMNRLLTIVEPDIGVVLNIGESHLEYLFSKNGVAREKFKLVEYLAKHNGTAFLNADDETILSLSEQFSLKKIFFGNSDSADVSGKIINMGNDAMEVLLHFSNQEYSAKLPFSGTHFLSDALAAISVGLDAKITIAEALLVLSTFSPLKGRGNTIKLSNEIVLIDETYNSNPLSLMKSLERLKGNGNHLVLILGDMLELGDEAVCIHRDVGKYIAHINPSALITFGLLAEEIAFSAKESGLNNVFSFTERDSFLRFLLTLEFSEKSIIFVKGSRGMKMEEFVEIISERLKDE